MHLIVEPLINEIHIYTFYDDDNSRFTCFKKAIDENLTSIKLKELVVSLTGGKKIESISFRILFGGEQNNSPELINDDFIEGMKKSFERYPFYMPSTERLIRLFYCAFPETPQYAYHEMSFFNYLPEEERLYALPSDYSENNNIKRSGYHGLCHKYHSERFPRDRKIISIILDRQTTICPLLSGAPLSINFGVTQLGGIMGRTSCGDIDAGIIFHLMKRCGYSIFKIDNILKRQSGFLGLTGYDMSIKEMIKLYGKDNKVTLAFDVYKNQILKYIGESLSVLEGVDTIIIGGNYVPFLSPVIYSVLKQISFLGINLADLPWPAAGDISEISSADSDIKVYINNLHISEIIHKETEKIMKIGA